jgi:His/Glu/Gln/Arg/opine family amino acid ABC transporter permease subunit
MPTVLINNFWYLGLGALSTIGISAASIVLSASIGICVALLQIFGGRVLRTLIEAYLYVVRGVPLLVLLFIMYYVLPYSGLHLCALEGGILVLGIYFGAFMSEVFRAAILSLPKSQ